mmetsp:Transcript_16896/g.36361  ORF Transcript_16896/g.36361 Transcript_16896/m.36361 type:complete len:119 (-) Transcript_16896:29-385(-)
MWSHHFTWGANIVLFGYLIRSVVCDKRRRTLTWFGTWAPMIFVVLGCFLSMIDPSRHVLLDHNGVFFKVETLAMYNEEGGLSTAGKLCQATTITGMTVMAIGILLFIDLPQKLFGARL